MWWRAFCWGTKGVVIQILVTLWFGYWRYSPASCNNWNSVSFKPSWQCPLNNCHALGRKPCPTYPSWLVAEGSQTEVNPVLVTLVRLLRTLCAAIRGGSCWGSEQSRPQKGGLQHPTAPHLMFTYLPSSLSLLETSACLGTVRHGPVTGRKAADARAV